MDTVSLLNNHSGSFIHFAWIMLVQSGILILVLTGIDLLLRRKVRAVFRYCLWMLVLVKLVLPVGLSLPYSPACWAGNLLPETKAADSSEVSNGLAEVTPTALPAGQPVPCQPVKISPMPTATPAEQITATEPAALQPSIEVSTDTPLQQAQVSISWQSFAALGWLIAVLIMLGLLIQRVFFVKSLIRQSKLAGNDLLSQLKQCALKMGMRPKVDIRISINAASPSVCGLIQPVILMPDNLSDHLSKNQIDAILMHELAHIKRGDLWINLIQALLQIAYFYNPLLWVANAIIRRSREQAVDEMVLAAMEDRAEDYPETLLNVSKLVWSKPMLSLRLIGVVESKSALTGRIKHILSRPFPKSAKLGIADLAAILIAAVVLLPMAQAKTETVDKYKKVFNNGLTVELAGVHLRNAENKMWWQPDGSKPGKFIETVDLSSYDSVDPAYEFVFKTSGNGTFKVESIKGSKVIFGVQVPERADMTGCRGHIKENVQETNIKIASPSGNWMTIIKSKGSGSVSGKFKSRTIILAAAEKAGTDTLISCSDQLGYKYATRLIAVDKYGKELTGEIKTDTGVNNIRQRTIRFTGLNLSDIAEFRFESCPYEYNTFKKVQLRPDFEAESPVEEKEPGSRIIAGQFSVYGKITDQNGNPLSGVTVRASCGVGTLMPTGNTVTAADGTYTLKFSPGFRSIEKDATPYSTGVQAATICAFKAGYYETGLCQTGNLCMAGSEQIAKGNSWLENTKGLILPNKPYKLNFKMARSAKIRGKLVDKKGKPIAHQKLWIKGKDLYPSTSVLATIETDKNGEFTVNDIPLKTFRFEFPVRRGNYIESEPMEITQPSEYKFEIKYAHPSLTISEI